MKKGIVFFYYFILLLLTTNCESIGNKTQYATKEYFVKHSDYIIEMQFKEVTNAYWGYDISAPRFMDYKNPPTKPLGLYSMLKAPNAVEMDVDSVVLSFFAFERFVVSGKLDDEQKIRLKGLATISKGTVDLIFGNDDWLEDTGTLIIDMLLRKEKQKQLFKELEKLQVYVFEYLSKKYGENYAAEVKAIYLRPRDAVYTEQRYEAIFNDLYANGKKLNITDEKQLNKNLNKLKIELENKKTLSCAEAINWAKTSILSGNKYILKLLKAYKIDLNCKDKEAKTIMDYYNGLQNDQKNNIYGLELLKEIETLNLKQ